MLQSKQALDLAQGSNVYAPIHLTAMTVKMKLGLR